MSVTIEYRVVGLDRDGAVELERTPDRGKAFRVVEGVSYPGSRYTDAYVERRKIGDWARDDDPAPPAEQRLVPPPAFGFSLGSQFVPLVKAPRR